MTGIRSLLALVQSNTIAGVSYFAQILNGQRPKSADFSLLVTRLNQDQVWVASRPYAVLIILKLAERFRQHM